VLDIELGGGHHTEGVEEANSFAKGACSKEVEELLDIVAVAHCHWLSRLPPLLAALSCA
jgi:hypothetical protein